MSAERGSAARSARTGERLGLLAVGGTTLVAQVVLLRELAVAFYGVELGYLLGLGLWLASGAAGAALRPGRGRSGSEEPGAAFLLLSLALPLAVAFLRGSRLLFGAVPGAYLPLGSQAASAALALCPVGAFSGALFRGAARSWVGRGGTLAAAYAWESAGGVAGGLLATLSLRAGVQNLTLGLACGVLAAGAAAFVSLRARPWAVVSVLGLLGLLVGAGALDRWSTGWTHRDLVLARDTPYGRVAVTGRGGQVAVFENDALAYESQGSEAEAFVHLAALQVPTGARALVLGGALQGFVAELLGHRPRAVDCVELDRELYRAVLPHLPPELRASLAAPGVRVIFQDPRRFLSVAGACDLILVGMPEPSSGAANRFYTREFFEQCAGRLSSGGVLAFRLPSAENFRTPQLLRRNAGIYAALRSAFADVLVLPGDTDFWLASPTPLPRDPEVLAGRLRARGIAGRLVTPEYLRYLYTNDRFAEVSAFLAGSRAPANTEGRPVCYASTVLLWLAKFLPGAARADLSGVGRWLWCLAAGVPGLFLLVRLRWPWRRVALAGVAGAAGMGMESVLILRYQLTSGVLYQDVGLLLAAFMAGLTLGAVTLDRMARNHRGRAVGAAVLGGACALNVAVAARVEAGLPSALLASASVLLLAGALTAALFAWASRQGEDGAEAEAVGPLYAADLLGGCLGAVLSGVVLIPFAGLGATAAGMAFLAVSSLLLL